MIKSVMSCVLLVFCMTQSMPSLAQQQSAVAKSASAAKSDAGHSDVVVSQGGAHVTLEDVDGFAEALPWDQRAAVFNDPQHIERILRDLLLTKQLANEAKAEGLDKDPMVRAGVELAIKQALAKARVQAFTAATKESIPDLSELAHERYLANPKAYAVPASTDVKHILIKAKDRSDAEAKALADKIHAALLKDPSTFDADVAEYSDDDSKKGNHGLIEDATSGQYVDNFSKAAKTLTKVGQISDPVKTEYGYHILKAVKFHPAKQPTFAEVRAGLVQKLQKEYVNKQVRDHVDGLKSKKLDPVPDMIASLRTRYQDQSTEKSEPSAD